MDGPNYTKEDDGAKLRAPWFFESTYAVRLGLTRSVAAWPTLPFTAIHHPATTCPAQHPCTQSHDATALKHHQTAEQTSKRALLLIRMVPEPQSNRAPLAGYCNGTPSHPPIFVHSNCVDAYPCPYTALSRLHILALPSLHVASCHTHTPLAYNWHRVLGAPPLAHPCRRAAEGSGEGPAHRGPSGGPLPGNGWVLQTASTRRQDAATLSTAATWSMHLLAGRCCRGWPVLPRWQLYLTATALTPSLL